MQHAHRPFSFAKRPARKPSLLAAGAACALTCVSFALCGQTAIADQALAHGEASSTPQELLLPWQSHIAYADTRKSAGGFAEAAEAVQRQLNIPFETYGHALESQSGEATKDIFSAQVLGLEDVTYTGNPFYPTITLKLDGNDLRQGEDFDVAFPEDTVNPGTIDAIITGKGDYSGTIEASFVIHPTDLSHANISVIPDQTATGSPVEPSPTVKIDGKELTQDKDYVVAYKNNVDAGMASLIIEGIGNCTGSARMTFVIKDENQQDALSQSAQDYLPLIAAPAALSLAALGVIGFATLRTQRKTTAKK